MMADSSLLDNRLIPGADAGADGMVRLGNAAGDAAVVSLQGAQVLSWGTAAGHEHLYCSPHPIGGQGRAVRGGVPVCFPQFAARGPLPKHGFARTSPWQLLEVNAAQTQARFQLQDSESTRAVWPHGFTATLAVSLESDSLALALVVANTGSTAWGFTAALHTYLRVEDVTQVRLWGLQGVRYEDALEANAVKLEEEEALHIAGELDRVYLGAPDALRLRHADGSHTLIGQQGFTDTVVWNPGPAKAAALGDMPAADWQSMLCIEAACVQEPVWLEPGDSWCGVQTLVSRV